MKRTALDVLGPLPVSNEGNKHLLIAMDYFTKWPKAYPLLSQEATPVANILVREFISWFGVPMEIYLNQVWISSKQCSKKCVNH